jgi:hypothetical protein
VRLGSQYLLGYVVKDADAEHCEQDVAPAPGQCDDGLGMVLPLDRSRSVSPPARNPASKFSVHRTVRGPFPSRGTRPLPRLALRPPPKAMAPPGNTREDPAWGKRNPRVRRTRVRPGPDDTGAVAPPKSGPDGFPRTPGTARQRLHNVNESRVNRHNPCSRTL